jgi:AraC family transcriptional activator of pobA
MDRQAIRLHYPDMKTIPTYALYGEQETSQDWLHWETIQSRSRLHDFRIAPHRHEHLFQLLHVTGGRARVVMDGVNTELRPGDVVVVPALTVHAFEFSPDIEGIVVTLLDRDIRGAAVPMAAAMVLHGQTRDVVEALGRLIAEADEPGRRHDVAMQAHIALLVLAIDRARNAPASTQGVADPARRHAKAFRDLVETWFRRTRSVPDYARAIGISPTHLHRVCREQLGATPLSIIERRVALEARRQLLFSTLSVKQIGAELGYDDPAYFTRVFTRMEQLSPDHFRKGRVRDLAGQSR